MARPGRPVHYCCMICSPGLSVCLWQLRMLYICSSRRLIPKFLPRQKWAGILVRMRLLRKQRAPNKSHIFRHFFTSVWKSELAVLVILEMCLNPKREAGVGEAEILRRTALLLFTYLAGYISSRCRIEFCDPKQVCCFCTHVLLKTSSGRLFIVFLNGTESMEHTHGLQKTSSGRSFIVFPNGTESMEQRDSTKETHLENSMFFYSRFY